MFLRRLLLQNQPRFKLAFGFAKGKKDLYCKSEIWYSRDSRGCEERFFLLNQKGLL